MERPDYIPSVPQEAFIVPILKASIDALLDAHAYAANGSSKALDVGCGRQPFRGSLESRGYSYVSLDTQHSSDVSVDFVCAIDEPLPAALLDLGPFNFILCTEVLEHVANWDRAFENLAALTCIGGKILLSCPHFYQLHEEPYDFWRPTPHAIRYFASRAGLNVVTVHKAGDAWDVLGTLLANMQVLRATHSLKARIVSTAVRQVLRIAHTALLRGRLLRRLLINSPLYLCNVAVLERS